MKEKRNSCKINHFSRDVAECYRMMLELVTEGINANKRLTRYRATHHVLLIDGSFLQSKLEQNETMKKHLRSINIKIAKQKLPIVYENFTILTESVFIKKIDGFFSVHIEKQILL